MRRVRGDIVLAQPQSITGHPCLIIVAVRIPFADAEAEEKVRKVVPLHADALLLPFHFEIDLPDVIDEFVSLQFIIDVDGDFVAGPGDYISPVACPAHGAEPLLVRMVLVS
jgi:hypothetical protein